MKKLLHERLRDAEHVDDVAEALGKYTWNSWVELAHDLADEIERYYIPRPRFEDGEPIEWHEKDIVWDNGKRYKFNAVTAGGRPLAYAGNKLFAGAELNDDGFVKRPSPKVLDADGVEIKVGDTMWRVSDGLKMKVIAVGKEALDQSCEVLTEIDGNGPYHYNGKELTHKEPDSLLNLLKDMEDLQEIDDVIPEWVDRLTALIERKNK